MTDDWVESLAGKVVVITGSLKPAVHLTRAEARVALWRLDAKLADDVSRQTHVLVRGFSPQWKFGRYGDREDEVARLHRQGYPVVIIPASGLGDLLDGRPAQTIAPQGEKPKRRFGAPYRDPPPPRHGKPIEIFEHDPVAMERAMQAHVDTQQALREAVVAAGLTPMSPFRAECDYDLAWRHGKDVIVAEVKSLTSQNERAQLRLGLGQVLDYTEYLRAQGWTVRPVLAVELEPTSERWTSICSASEVRLVWPETFGALFG